MLLFCPHITATSSMGNTIEHTSETREKMEMIERNQPNQRRKNGETAQLVLRTAVTKTNAIEELLKQHSICKGQTRMRMREASLTLRHVLEEQRPRDETTPLFVLGACAGKNRCVE